MTHVRPLSPYAEGRSGEAKPKAKASALSKYATGAGTRPESPPFDSMDEESVTNSIPIANFKSNNIKKKIEDLPEEPLSPGALTVKRDMGFKSD